MVMGVALAALLTVVSTGAAGAETTGYSVSISSLAATPESGAVAVAGSAVTTDTTVWVGEGKSPKVPGAGLHITDLTIARSGNNLLFTMDIADQPPVIFGVPEVVSYIWGIDIATDVDEYGGGGDVNEYILYAWRTAPYASPGVDPVFEVDTCDSGSNGVSTCTGSEVGGQMQDGIVQWTVPLSDLGPAKGGQIVSENTGTGIGARLSLEGALVSPILMANATQYVDYVIPATTVALALQKDGATVATGTGSVDDDGSFTKSIATTGLASGAYQIVAKACYGYELDDDGIYVVDDNYNPIPVCSSQSTDVALE
jgi:hypothetical protein